MDLYHTTDVPPEIILKEGLIGRKSKGFSTASGWVFEYGWLPSNSIFLSSDPGAYGEEGKYTYAVNVSGLNLLADYPSLVDKGAMIEEDGYLWWQNLSDVPQSLRDLHDEEYGIDKDNLTGEDTLKATGTAVVVGTISPNRIKLFKSSSIARVISAYLSKH